MGDASHLTILAIFFVFWIALFIFNFILNIRYLRSVFGFLRALETHEPEIWSSLGRPRIGSDLRMYELAAHLRFVFWYLRGAKDLDPSSPAFSELQTMRSLFKKSFLIMLVLMLSFGTIFVYVAINPPPTS